MTTTQTYIMWRETIGCIPVYNRLQYLFYYTETTLKMFKTGMFCFGEDNKKNSGLKHIITEPDWKSL
jgi:hypothetical protein